MAVAARRDRAPARALAALYKTDGPRDHLIRKANDDEIDPVHGEDPRALPQPAQRGHAGRTERRRRPRGQPRLRRHHGHLHRGRGRPHQGDQVPDLRLRLRRGHLEHDHRVWSGHAARRGPQGQPRRRGRRARRAAADQDALQQPGGRRAARGHQELARRRQARGRDEDAGRQVLPPDPGGGRRGRDPRGSTSTTARASTAQAWTT